MRRAQRLCKRREYTSNTEKPASISVRPPSPPLAATTSASQAHSSLIYLPCSQLLFFLLHLFCSLLPLSYVCILDSFLCLIMAKMLLLLSQPAGYSDFVFAWIWECIRVKWITEHLLYGSICLSNLGISHQKANLSFDVAAVECKTFLKWVPVSNLMQTLVNCGVSLQSGVLERNAANLICVNMFVIIMGLWLV